MSNVEKNRLVAYQQYVGKLEKTITLLRTYAILVTCALFVLSAYIVWRGI